jgi:transcriptional regulator with XRE-family HTH domain
MNLRKERMAKKLTIPELSQATRIEADKLRNYEMGADIPYHHAQRIRDVLYVDLKFYFGRHFND